MPEDYVKWRAVAQHIADNRLTNWKTLPDVNCMLEHVSYNLGSEYLQRIVSVGEIDTQMIQHLADINDRYGGAVRESYGSIVTSPSSLRYIAQAIEICKHIKSKNLNNITIIEVGGGYGGLSLILHNVAKLRDINITKYIIYDLKEIGNLQKYYLSFHEDIKNVVWNDSTTFGADLHLDAESSAFLVSNYCISELSQEYRTKYLVNLIPMINGAFMAWNLNDTSMFSSDVIINDEVPQTGTCNKIILI